MHALLLNMIWPALWVSTALWKCWFLIFATIAIETAALRWVSSWSWKKVLQAAIIGNVISGLAGVFVMPILMLFWHLVWAWTAWADLDQSSIVPSLILMSFGSVVIEYFVVKRGFGKQRYLFLCLLVGNLITYGATAALLATDKKFKDDVADEILGYRPPKYGAFLSSGGDSILTFWNGKRGPASIRLLRSRDKIQVGMGGVLMRGTDGAYSTAGLSSGSYIVEMSSLGDTVFSYVIVK